MKEINALLEQAHAIQAAPDKVDALDILAVFRSLRWEVQLLEESIFNAKFDKEGK